MCYGPIAPTIRAIVRACHLTRSACSHTLTTRQPFAFNSLFTLRSRALFVASFVVQNAMLPLGCYNALGSRARSSHPQTPQPSASERRSRAFR